MLSVTCTQCNAHYTMSEELYRRKGGGQAVIVTCKRCKAEIRFETNHLAEDKPPHRSLPKPKVPVSKALEDSGDESGPFVALSSGFFGPEMVSAASDRSSKPFPQLPEIESSLDSAVDSAAVQPIHVSSPAAARSAASSSSAAKPAAPVASEFLDDDEAMSVRSTDLLDESVTVPLVAPKPHGTGTIRRFPAPPPRRNKEGEHEPLPPPRRTVDEDSEPAPPSSSGTPTLTTLMGESTVSNAPRRSKKPDDFLLNLSASPATELGPPTIDLTSVASPNVEAPESAPPPSVGESESDAPPRTLGSVAPAGKKRKKRRAAGTSGAPSARPSARPTTEQKRNQPSAASAPVAKPAEQRESAQRPLGLWIGVLVLLGLGVGAVFFKSSKKEEVVASNDSPAAEPVAPVVTAPPIAAPAATVAEPVATTSAAPIASAPALEKKPEKASQAKPSEASASGPAAEVKPAADAKPEAEAKPADKPTESAEATAAAAEPPAAQHGPFQAAAAKAALAEAAAQAAACRKGDDPAGNAAVIITFAPSGRVTSATLSGPPFAGTATGGCIASTMRRAKVPPFDGDMITVSKTIYVQ
jgi:hypothetical protein